MRRLYAKGDPCHHVVQCRIPDVGERDAAERRQVTNPRRRCGVDVAHLERSQRRGQMPTEMCGSRDFPPPELVRIRLATDERAPCHLCFRPQLEHLHVEVRSKGRVQATDYDKEPVENVGERMNAVVVRKDAAGGGSGSSEAEYTLDVETPHRVNTQGHLHGLRRLGKNVKRERVHIPGDDRHVQCPVTRRIPRLQTGAWSMDARSEGADTNPRVAAPHKVRMGNCPHRVEVVPRRAVLPLHHDGPIEVLWRERPADDHSRAVRVPAIDDCRCVERRHTCVLVCRAFEKVLFFHVALALEISGRREERIIA